MFIKLLKEVFYMLTGALVLFSSLEIIWPGLVLAHLNINWVLIFWFIIAILIIIIPIKEIRENNKEN